jgi:hypothetical protein
MNDGIAYALGYLAAGAFIGAMVGLVIGLAGCCNSRLVLWGWRGLLG